MLLCNMNLGSFWFDFVMKFRTENRTDPVVFFVFFFDFFV